MTEGLLLTPMFRRVQFSKTVKFMKQFVVFICRFVIVRGATAFLQVNFFVIHVRSDCVQLITECNNGLS